jgi:hypothetical protein
MNFSDCTNMPPDAAENCAGAYGQAARQQLGGLVRAGFCAGEAAVDGEDDPQEVEVSAGWAGQGNGNRVGTGGGAVSGVGHGLIRPLLRTRLVDGHLLVIGTRDPAANLQARTSPKRRGSRARAMPMSA